MYKIQVGDKLRAIFTQALPHNDVAPELKHGMEYECKGVHTDAKGFDHIDVGLPVKWSYVTSYATGERLPQTCHWCHPNRFLIIQSKTS
jgi:hypothetical protein